MIDFSARQKYSQLLKRLVQCELTSTDFFESQERYETRASKDPALKAIDDMVWFTYSEEIPQKFKTDSLPAETKHFFDRVFVFLNSAVEYSWPAEEFPKVSELGPIIKILTLGLSSFVDSFLQQNSKSFWAEFGKHGDLTAWPFISTQSFEQQKQSVVR